jgi:hypothetical protein
VIIRCVETITTRKEASRPATQLFKSFQLWQRNGRPYDFAAMALYLTSDDSELVSEMAVDGAATSGNGRMKASRRDRSLPLPSSMTNGRAVILG